MSDREAFGKWLKEAFYHAPVDSETLREAFGAGWQAAQAQAVNQQLLEALEATLQTVEDYTILIHEEWGDCRTLEKIEADGELHKSVLIARAAIAAAQQRHGAEGE